MNIAELEAENAALKEQLAAERKETSRLVAREFERMTNDAKELIAPIQKDAERYRFMRSNNRNYCPLCGYDGLDCYQKEELDAAIDAEMEKKE